jgi:hypothetical protein
MYAERHGRPLWPGSREILLLVLAVSRVRSGLTWTCKGSIGVIYEALMGLFRESVLR